MTNKKIAVFDLESNGLLDATKIHCLVVRDYRTNESKAFIGMESRDECCEYLDSYDVLIAHNGIDFDLELMKRLWNYQYKGTIIDTLVMSRLLYPDRPPVEGVRGPHSVEAWGKRLGRWKPEHEDWSTFSPEMLHRCTEDTEIQTMIYQTLLHEAGITDKFASIFESSSYKTAPVDWSVAMTVEHKSAQCMRDQATRGVFFKKEDAERYVSVLNGIMDEIEEKLLKRIPASPKQKGVPILEPFTKTGQYKKMVTDWYPHLVDALTYANMLDCVYKLEVNGPFTRIEWNTINLGSDKQVKDWLYSLGWEPDEWNFKKGEYNPDGSLVRTSPKITASSLKSIDPNLAELLETRSKASHRRNQIQGFLDNLRDDGRIEAQANPIGTPTCRMTHRKVANIPKANSDKETHELIWYPDKQSVFFGTEMRSLFSVDKYPEWQLIGRDAAGLELRCFAHYINDDVYTDVILNGDIHTYNMEAAGLTDRDQAKTFILKLG